MPLSVAQYLRHLSTRCSRMARDCYDPAVTKELEIISIELVEKARNLEAVFAISGASGETAKSPPETIGSIDDDGEDAA